MKSQFTLEIQVSTDRHGRWQADVVSLPGAIACAPTRDEALEKAKAVSFRILAYRLEHGLPVPGPISALFLERLTD